MNAYALVTIGLLSLGQAAPDEAELKKVLIPHYGRDAARYDFFLDKERSQRIELQEQPVLTWTNAENYMGAVFVWNFKGRPEIIGCIGSHQLRSGEVRVFHEFHSLATQPLQPLRIRTGELWEPKGVPLTPVEESPRPSDSERLRLTQMRNIAREFKGWMKDREDTTELRLLPQPLVRYKAPDRGIVDGAIFAFVWKGTDPEVLLVLEARKSKDEVQWQYALARFNWREMWVERKEKELWRVKIEARNDSYLSRVVSETTLDAIRVSQPKADSPEKLPKKQGPIDP